MALDVKNDDRLRVLHYSPRQAHGLGSSCSKQTSSFEMKNTSFHQIQNAECNILNIRFTPWFISTAGTTCKPSSAPANQTKQKDRTVSHCHTRRAVSPNYQGEWVAVHVHDLPRSQITRSGSSPRSTICFPLRYALCNTHICKKPPNIILWGLRTWKITCGQASTFSCHLTSKPLEIPLEIKVCEDCECTHTPGLRNR